jgi:hypothetical protein
VNKDNPFFDLKWFSLLIVGVILFILTLAGFVRAVKSGEGLEPGVASAGFALLGALVAGAMGSGMAVNNSKKEKEEEPTDIDPEDY